MYLDPASGSTIFQLAIASVLSLLATLRYFWSSVRRLFARLRGQAPARSPE
jgi:hypothetical protein